MKLKLSYSDNSSEEVYKTKLWIDRVLNLPCELKKDNDIPIKDRLLNIKNALDNKIYGQKDAKERILEIMGAVFNNPNECRSCFAMEGSPGVGKTAFALCLAEALNRPFYQISLGGLTDPHFINGHSPTYIGAIYGEIVAALMHMQCLNGILFLDEFDKINSKGEDVSNAFLNILDYTQNHAYKDQYMPEIKIDLSHLIIIISVNDIDKVDNIVADRMPVIYFSGYNTVDKLVIGKNYFIPKIEKRLKFASDDIIITKSILKYIVSKLDGREYTGVRRLEHCLERIYDRLNVLRLLNSKEADDDKEADKDDSKNNDKNDSKNNDKDRMNDKKKEGIKLSYNISRFSIPFKIKKKHIDILMVDDCEDSDDDCYFNDL